MPRQRDPRRDEAFEIWKQHKGKITNREIANQLDVDEKKVAVWKQRDKWNVVQQTNESCTTNDKNITAKRKRSGNPNPENQFTERNKASERHGLFAKFLPDETLEIVDRILDNSKTLDLLWDQIRIQYAAILRSQRIMFVRNHEDMTKEIKKEKEFSSQSGGGSEVEYEIQFAWDKQASFLNAQSRAMSTLESLITKYEQLLPNSMNAEEQRLKLEKMKVEIAKVKGDDGETEDDGFMEALKSIEEVWTDDNEG